MVDLNLLECNLQNWSINMSLLSKKDHDMVIEALDFYLFSKGNDFPEEKRLQLNSLLAWVKLKSAKTF